MALRTKTIEYALDGNRASASVATGATMVFPTTSIWIPETSSRQFASVVLEANFRDAGAAAASLTSCSLIIQLGTAAANAGVTTTTLTNSGEQQSFVWTRDVTQYFSSSFGNGPSQSCAIGIAVGGITTNNHSAKLHITYQYDDAANTRAKTVRIPLNSTGSILSATMLNLGSSSQIPALDTFLPEANKTYRAIWFEMYGNDATTTVGSVQLRHALDAEVAVSGSLLVQTLNSALWNKMIWRRDDMATSTTHSLVVGVNSASKFTNFSSIMHVTYEYDHSASSTIMNSLMLPLIEEAGFVGTAPNYSSRLKQEVRIAEPTPIQLQQSAIQAYYTANGAGVTAIRIAANNQSNTTYTRTNGTLSCGQYHFTHRIDSGSPGGQALTLQRGKNDLVVVYDQTENATNTLSNFSALLYLNYTSGKHSNGDQVHNQTRTYLIHPMAALNAAQRYDAHFAPTASVDPYRNTGLGIQFYSNYGGNDAGAICLSTRITGSLESSSVDLPAWCEIYASAIDGAVERQIITPIARAREVFRRYEEDPDNSRLFLTTRRLWRCDIPGPSATNNLGNSNVSTQLLWTYHNIYTPVTRSISGYTSGDGSGISIQIFDSASKEMLYVTQSVSGGFYYFNAYEPSQSFFAVAYDSASNKRGISNYFTASF